LKVAIVGAGVSGLVCARLLDRRCDVTLFEASPRIGGHACTERIVVDGRVLDVDTGFVVYNERTYPLFTRLLAELGVATQPTEMSFSVSCERTGVEYSGGSLRGLFADPLNLVRPRFLGMVRDVLRFYRDAAELLDRPDAKASLGEWLEGRGYGEAFVEHHLLPMGAAIWSAAPGRIRDFPAAAFARFFANHGLLALRDRPQWRVVRGGSARYVERLLAGLRARVHVGTPVRGAWRDADGVELVLERGERAHFDQVVFATHADQTLACLRDPSAAERALLGAARFTANEAVLHTDARFLPRRRHARASWNFALADQPRAAATVTYDMTRLQRLDASRPVLVTLNSTREIDPARVLQTYRVRHPAYDLGALEAQAPLRQLSGANRTWFCGAWCGFGFHEDGVRSAHEVATALARRA
jgi:predicted NAD/FAD-binding protein